VRLGWGWKTGTGAGDGEEDLGVVEEDGAAWVGRAGCGSREAEGSRGGRREDRSG